MNTLHQAEDVQAVHSSVCKLAVLQTRTYAKVEDAYAVTVVDKSIEKE
jgi:hypothetical protein